MQTWYSRYTQVAPSEERVYVERELLDLTCPACGSGDVRRYPIANYQGPRIVTKCQNCFHVLALERPRAEDNWPPFRSVTYDWDASLCERASRVNSESPGEKPDPA